MISENHSIKAKQGAKQMRFDSKEEFITRVMNGERFRVKGTTEEYYYDDKQQSPFRVDSIEKRYSWNRILTEWDRILTEWFEVVEPIVETRWKMMKDHDNYTYCSDSYYPQRVIDVDWGGHYKGDSIEVTL